MRKTLLLFICFISFHGYSQNDHKDWSARQKTVNAVHGPMNYNIDSVIAITDFYEVKGVRYIGLDVIYSEYLHWENLRDLYFDEFERSEIPPFDTLKFYENFVTDYGKIYGADNVVRTEDVDFFSDCGQCERTYRIKNIRLKMYGVYYNDQKKWGTLPDSEGIEILPTPASKKPKSQEALNEIVPKKIQLHFRKDATYHPVAAFEGVVQLDPKNDLHKAIGIYIKAINEENGEEELKMTHPKIVNALRIYTDKKNTAPFLVSTGFLGQYVKMNQVVYIAPVLTSEEIKYTKLIIKGSFELDFSTMEVTPDVSFAFSMLPTMYQQRYGVSNVNADNETKIITISNVEFPIYAVHNSQIGEWKFTTVAYSPLKGISLDNLWEFTEKTIDASPEQWVEAMEDRKDQIDVIIPPDIILKLE